MKDQRLTLRRDTLVDYPLELFGNWYDANYNLLKKIAKQLDSDFAGFSSQTGANRLAFYQVRIKDRASFLDKIETLRNNPKLLEKKLPANLPEEFQPQDVIKDLIGGRLVFYFENDLDLPINYFDTYPQFVVDEIKAYQVLPENSPLADPSKKILHERLKKICRAFSPETKPSAYESFHMMVRYNPPYVAVRSLVPPRTEDGRIADMNDGKDCMIEHADLKKISLEIQIRTILQHTWAQTEHRLNYNLKKRLTEVPYNDEHFLDDFRCHKAILFAAEHHQRIIYNRFWDMRYSHFIKRDSADLGNRLFYFSKNEKKEITNINSKLHSNECSELYAEISNLKNKLHNKYKRDFFVLTFKNGIASWGRQRLFLLLYGYLLLVGNESTINKIVGNLKINQNFVDYDPSSITIYLFEHIRSMDTLFRWQPSTPDQRRFFSDPLVNYRCAGAHLKHNNYRRCIRLLKEVIDEDYFEGFKVEGGLGNFLNKMHFYRRIGEYYSYLYFEDNCFLRTDLLEAIENMQRAFNAEGPLDKESLVNERIKVLSNLITYSFFRYLYLLSPNYASFKGYINTYKTIISDLFTEDKIASSKSCHFFQALALIKYSENEIKDYIRFIDISHQIMIEKQAVMSVSHRFVIQAIYDYLTTNDATSHRTNG